MLNRKRTVLQIRNMDVSANSFPGQILLPYPKQILEGSSSASVLRKRRGLKVIGSEYCFESWAIYQIFGIMTESLGMRTGG